MSTQMSMAIRGIATEEMMMQVTKDEDVDMGHLIRRVANGSIIIPNTQSVALIDSWPMTLLL